MKSLKIVSETKKGLLNGPATIYINDKKVCKTSFSDQIEFVKSVNHPVGVQNQVSRDRAAINCLLVVASLACLVLSLVTTDLQPVWIVLFIVLYVGQLIEVAFC